ncbi:uncharacterized protein BX663DRAFT_437563 [Cokeromyces recurvatus]|uniref:uncharacterized protein n=1 Tax=Cokeromyces recurvatus TaxID=90255 RepID=UPI00221F9AF7|nr:uncharacterized protein BX663DRAFT_437563 [Cokeromyces recurvatus]KAI7901336.1 hypothetical protein BX663DRAFT_437563 [Cokeromyces recurvatus]
MNRELISSNHLQLYPSSSLPPLLINPSSSTRFSFELPLPSGIPETIHCPQIEVDYHLIVSLKYKMISSKISEEERAERQVILARLPDNESMLGGENYYPATIDSHKHFSNYCQYRITIDKKSAPLGSKLPIKIEIAPTIKDLRIKHLFLQLVERRIVFVGEEERMSQSVHYLYPVKNTAVHLPLGPLNRNWEGNYLYQIPDERLLSHSTQSYSQFHVQHILLVSLLVSIPAAEVNSSSSNSRYVTRTISFQTNFDLLDSHLLNEREYSKLPSYNSPISTKEIETLYQHGLCMKNPPSYEESLTVL